MEPKPIQRPLSYPSFSQSIPRSNRIKNESKNDPHRGIENSFASSMIYMPLETSGRLLLHRSRYQERLRLVAEFHACPGSRMPEIMHAQHHASLRDFVVPLISDKTRYPIFQATSRSALNEQQDGIPLRKRTARLSMIHADSLSKCRVSQAAQLQKSNQIPALRFAE